MEPLYATVRTGAPESVNVALHVIAPPGADVIFQLPTSALAVQVYVTVLVPLV